MGSDATFIASVWTRLSLEAALLLSIQLVKEAVEEQLEDATAGEIAPTADTWLQNECPQKKRSESVQ